MSIRKKILGGFIAIVIMAMAIGIIGVISTRTLTEMAYELEEFQEEVALFSVILNSHNTWRNNLTRTTITGDEFTGSLDPTKCMLGTWLLSEEAQNIEDPEISELISQIIPPHNAIHYGAAPITRMVEMGDLLAAQEELMTAILPELEKVIAGLTAVGARYNVLVTEKVEEMEEIGAMFTTIVIAVIAVAAVVAVWLALWISGMISKPLTKLTSYIDRAGTTGDIAFSPDERAIVERQKNAKDEIGQCIRAVYSLVAHITKISEELEEVAKGDLRTQVDFLSEKDVMGIALQHTVDSLNELFSSINQSSAQVSMGSKQLADGAQSLAQGSTEQAATVQQLSSSISEIAQKTKDNAEMAGRAAALANTIKGNAEKGSRQMDEMMEAVKEINQAGQSISRVIKVIDDIAFQTNILALNAAVEAARAGQHGKGFAVVAEEVRNLASKSAEAAKDTGNLIADSIEKAELGSRIASDTATSLGEIVSGINESAQIVSDIAESSEQQSRGIVHINQGIDQVAEVIHQNSATAEQSAASSEEMSNLSDMLEDLISQFKLKDSVAVHPGLPAVRS